jgi:rhodanese-related sulfurtransferase
MNGAHEAKRTGFTIHRVAASADCAEETMEHRTVDELLSMARARLDRVPPSELEAEIAAGALVVDTRPVEQRERDGDLPGAMVIDRNVLEWRLDPVSPTRIAEAGYDVRIVVVCNEGYSSSLVAATLQDLGLSRATDLVGGFQAWLALHRSGGGHL